MGWVSELPEPQQDPEHAREMADEILSRPEYDEPSPSLLERVLEWIGERLGDLFDDRSLSGGDAGGSAAFLDWLALIVLVAAVVGLLAWAISKGVFRRTRSRKRGRDETEIETEESRSVSDWLTVAAEHEAAGRWREGLLCRYRALVVDLCDRGVLSELAGRTAGEYVQEVAASPQAERSPDMPGSFARATSLFEEVWYGGADAGPAERDRFAGLVGAAAGSERTRESGDRP